MFWNGKTARDGLSGSGSTVGACDGGVMTEASQTR
jgi:hypothetical protein